MMENKMWELALVNFPLADGKSFYVSKTEHCKPLYEAMLGLAKNNHGEESDFAVGTRAMDNGGETVFIEHAQGTDIARLELAPGKARASMSNMALGNDIKALKDLADIAAAVWYAYIAFDTNGGIKSPEASQDLHELLDALYKGIEDDEVQDFEVKLTNFEAKAMIMSGPVTGSEKSLPVLSKRAKGPNKIISGEFRTFPDSGKTAGVAEAFTSDDVEEFVLMSEPVKKAREKASRTPVLKALVPNESKGHVYSAPEMYSYKVAKDTENDKGDLAVKVFQFTGSAAVGKSEVARMFANRNKLPFGSYACNESTKISDITDDLWVPYLEKGEAPSLTDPERAVNATLKSDNEGRDALEIAREALGYPSAIEVKFDPAYAWESLGRTGVPEDSLRINQMIDEETKKVLNSLKEKLEHTAGAFLAYKMIPSVFRLLFENGGVFEIGEAATMRKGEMSKLHDLIDMNRRAYLETSDGLVYRNDAFYVFFTNNLEYEEDHPMTIPMISRMALDIEFPDLTEDQATDRLCSVLGCEEKRAKAKEIVTAYTTLGKEAVNRSLPGGIDFRNLKQIGNRILNHGYSPREVFEREIVHHFCQHSDPESKTSDELALLGLLDELDLFR